MKISVLGFSFSGKMTMDRNNIRIWYFTVLLANIFVTSHAYTITVDAHAEECFFESIETNKKVGLMFEVVEGGFLDIDVTITGPDGSVIYQGVRESSGQYAFSTINAGRYTYCFSNKMSTMTPKVVMFDLEMADAKTSAAGETGGDSPNKLDDMIKELSSTLKTVKHDQEYMLVRDRIHRSINESTNSRVVMWSIFEASVLLLMTLGQVYYLKRFFEVQRVV